jgi:hypothetical protein
MEMYTKLQGILTVGNFGKNWLKMHNSLLLVRILIQTEYSQMQIFWEIPEMNLISRQEEDTLQEFI